MGLLLAAISGCVGSTLPEPSAIVSGRDGTEASFESMIDDLLEARVVYVGEAHDREAHHQLQAAIVRALFERDPSLAIGLEMVQRPFQEPLSAYVEGRIDEEELLVRVEWRQRWGFDFAMYRPLLEHAREHGIRVVALNAPKELTRAIARGGLDSLDEEMRAGLVELDTADARHREMVREALSGHGGMDEARLERFYLAQVVWDETMADSVARTLAAPGGPRRMVVLAGQMHVREGAGIPRRAARRGAEPYRIVLPVGPDEPPADGVADWLVVFE